MAVCDCDRSTRPIVDGHQLTCASWAAPERAHKLTALQQQERRRRFALAEIGRAEQALAAARAALEQR